MERDSDTAADGGEATTGEGVQGTTARAARNAQAMTDLDALRVSDPAGYAEALALLADLEQRGRAKKE